MKYLLFRINFHISGGSTGSCPYDPQTCNEVCWIVCMCDTHAMPTCRSCCIELIY